MSWLAGAAVAVAVLAAAGPRGRSVGAVARPGSRTGGSRGSAVLRTGGRRGVAGFVAAVRGARQGTGPDLALLVTDVAARLRAGAEPRRAWESVLGRPVGPLGPVVQDLCRSADARPQAAAVVAAGRLAAELGAPLAPLLDGVAAQLSAEEESDGERRAALAGPRATARVLTALPALGVLLGSAVGADPVAVLLDGSWGSAALAGGVLLVLVGRVWTGRLARAAAAAGRPT